MGHQRTRNDVKDVKLHGNIWGFIGVSQPSSLCKNDKKYQSRLHNKYIKALVHGTDSRQTDHFSFISLIGNLTTNTNINLIYVNVLSFIKQDRNSVTLDTGSYSESLINTPT